MRILTPPQSASQGVRHKGLERLIILYFLLLIFEGALRKWTLASLSNPLLIIRDPVVMMIYVLAMRNRVFPGNPYMLVMLMIAICAFFFGMLADRSNIMITLYGLRINFLHLPLVFIMPQVLTRHAVYQIGKLSLWIALPMTLIVMMQFSLPQEHWLNHQPGGDVGAGLTGGLGKFRPSGTFSFVAGLGSFYPMITAFLLAFVMEREKVPFTLLIAAGICVALSIPCSMSRSLALTCGLVLVMATFGVTYKKGAPKILFKVLIAMCIMIVSASFLPIFDTGVEAFQDRWVTASGTTAADYHRNIIDRFFGSFTQSSDFLEKVTLLGAGIGMGSNVAAKLLTGGVGFLLAEDEWLKIIMELGPLLGLAFIGLRVMIALHMLGRAYRALRQGNVLPMLLMAALGLLMVNGQWGPPMILGFSVFGAGLILSACNPPYETEPQKVRRRYFAQSFMVAAQKSSLKNIKR